ncbi:MAG: ribonuclease R [Malacoplasma sp.]|nr:ribonuclease R [Malacoplasma sp.]
MYIRKNNSLSPIEKVIIDILSNDPRPIPVNILVKKVNNKNTRNVFSALNYLIDIGLVEKLANGKVVLGYTNGKILESQKFKGTITLNSKGDGFFKKENQKISSIYINKKNLNSALDNDVVEVCLMDKNPTYDDLEGDGIVTNIIERNRAYFTGTYYCSADENGDLINSIIPDDKKINLKIYIDDAFDLVNGNKVLLRINRISNDAIYCSLSKILGHIDDVGNDIISIVYDNEIDPEFSDAVEEETKAIDFNFTEAEDKKRKDLSDIDFVTIDPLGSKDMDDAICVVKNNENTFKLYVAIADVSYYVRLNSQLWNAALERGTSIYLVNQVIPMLPHKLSNNICSLNPFEKRYAQICEMDIDHNGNFVNIQVYPGIIKSKFKFTYDEVNEYFLNKTTSEKVKNNIYQMLDTSLQLYHILDKKRRKQGYIEFEIPEPKIILDEFEKIKDIVLRKSGTAQKMIENFMVAANEAVTLNFQKKFPNLNFVYRVHDKPDEHKIEAFKIEAKKLGFIFDSSLKSWKPNTISNWLKKNLDNPNINLINIILLRTMAKATYETKNIGHFGLSIKNYTHFTSPIRRLADVIVHYLNRIFIFEPENYNDSQKQYILDNLDYFCTIATKTEIKAVETEREVNAMKFAEYMSEHIGYEFNGFVSYITSFGLFVQLENTIEGLVKPINIKDDRYFFDEQCLTYVGKNYNKVISLGQKVRIKVIGADKNTRKIDFEIIKYLA